MDVYVKCITNVKIIKTKMSQFTIATEKQITTTITIVIKVKIAKSRDIDNIFVTCIYRPKWEASNKKKTKKPTKTTTKIIWS